MRCRNVMRFVVGGVCLLGIVTQLQAMTITNVTDGVLKFENTGYEVEPLGVGPSYASPGWQRNYFPADVVIDDASPGPFSGSQYVKTVRTLFDTGGPRSLFADWNVAGHEAAIENTPGKLIHAEFMMYQPSSSTDGFIIIEGYTTYYRGAYRTAGGTLQAYDSVLGYYDTSVTYAQDAWVKWEVDYVVGSNTATISADGNSVALPTYADGQYGVQGGGDMFGIGFGHADTGGLFYLDAVPEPASAGIIGFCGLGLVGRRRRHNN